jgi:hypothetical protein
LFEIVVSAVKMIELTLKVFLRGSMYIHIENMLKR